MKPRFLILLVAPLFSTTVLAAGYTGPGAEVVSTVVAANNASDDTPVILKGFVIKN
jgi:uncharacterized protein YdeI (BOF family)